MPLIAQHPYIKVERMLTSTSKYNMEHDRFISLYTDKVTTEHRTFPIADVIDFSYRKITTNGGILYLHSVHGVYSYTVKTSPEDFIMAFKDHFKYKS